MYNILSKNVFALIGTAMIAGCVSTTEPQTPPTPRSVPQPTEAEKKQTQQAAAAKKNLVPTKAQINDFGRVISRVEPVAEQQCQARAPQLNCDFKLVLDRRANMPPNAFQSVDPSGRPVLTVTQSLVADVQNADELAFVVGHEAAHHISGHLARKQSTAMAGAVVLGAAAAILGAGGAGVDMAMDVGAGVGARTYSKNYELEADALGTVIAKQAGYNPVRGAQYFTRIPDPGDRFLGSHPPNAQRIETVKRVNAKL